ncbi:MAG TPA: bifunctional diguanylate cyclase/phosphodiesterase, partial [Solirubrobacteraceae bacterium]
PLRDPLTELPTRELLREHLTLARARAQDRDDGHVALMWTGFDEFRLVNQSFGYEAGDRVLREAAERLKGVLQPTNVLARPAGDQFAILLADLGPHAERVAEIVAEQVSVALSEPFRVDGRDLRLSASIGISLLPSDATDEDGLLRHAEAAMHDAKREGGASYTFYAGATREALERLMLTTRLHRALDRRELNLHFQPIVALPANRACGVEALLRWDDPTQGQIAPMSFIPLAEYTGLIEPIGAWVLAAACAQARAWREQGIDLPVFVNVSLRQFRQPGFGAQVRASLAEAGLDPSALVLEITESTAMAEPGCIDPILAELRGLGVRIAIDDFGTGYSSFARLHEMPVDIVKIDRALLSGAPEQDGPSRLAGATIDILATLGMQVVAEGVETPAQLQFLVERGCPMAQGFHLSRPAPAAEVTGRLVG